LQYSSNKNFVIDLHRQGDQVMKSISLVLIALSTSVSPLANATSLINGCQLGSATLPFKHFTQQGAARVAFVELSQNAYVEYRNVYNQASLRLVVDNQIVASSTALMAPVHLKATFDGETIDCSAPR
jgi:hypothetical protein